MNPPAATLAQTVQALRRQGGRPDFLRLLSATGEVATFSYREVVDLALRWSAFYARRGLRRGARVVVILPHSIDLYAAYLGALLGGQVPAMFAFPSAKLSAADYGRTIGHLLDNAEPDLVVTYAALKRDLSNLLPNRAALFVYPPLELPSVEPDAFASLDGSLDDTAFLQYSSGTTGLKKGVAITQRALLWQIDAYRRAIRLDENDVIVSWLPLYHDMGLICCFFLPLLTGTPLVAMSPFDWVKRPVMMLEAITRFRGTLGWLPNFAYNFLAENVSPADAASLDLSSLRGLVNCSEPVMAVSHGRFFARFAPCGLRPEMLAASYAMAETTFAITSGGFNQPLKLDVVDGRELVSSGAVLADTQVDIVSDNGTLLPERQIGEIAVRSPSLLRDYHRNPEATAASLRDGRFFTGDLGYLADGHLFVTGRKKDLIILAGKNLYPQDIEDAVNQVPGVIPGRVVAFGVADPAHGTERLVVVAETGRVSDDVREHLVRCIFAVVAAQTDGAPGDVRLVEHLWLVKSSSGKLSRDANRRRYLDLLAAETPAAANAPAPDAPNASLRDAITACVLRVLRQKKKNAPASLPPDTPLVRTGLIDSLSLVTLVMELESALGVAIPADRLDARHFETVSSIETLLRQLSTPAAPSTSAPATRAKTAVTDDAPGYDAYVSLGFNCEAGLQFQRIGYDESSFFRFTFTSLESTLALLQNDFADVFLKENLVPHTDTLVRDTKYNIVFHSDLRSAKDPVTGERRFLADYDFDAVHRLCHALTIQNLAAKSRRLAASDARVLYVLKLESGQSRAGAEKLFALIREKYPRHRFTLLCLQPEDRREPNWPSPGPVNRYLPRFAPVQNAYDADLAAWDALFAEFPLKRAAHSVSAPNQRSQRRPVLIPA